MARACSSWPWRSVLAALAVCGALLAVSAWAVAEETTQKDGDWDVFPTQVRLKDLPDGTTPGLNGEYGKWETSADGKGALPFPTSTGGNMQIECQKATIRVDANGDGNVRNDRPCNDSQTGTVIRFKFKYADGSEGDYASRIHYEMSCHEIRWERACYREATAYGQKIILVDDSNNGKYTDALQDGLVIGNRVSYVSPVVIIDGELYDFKTDDAGSKIWLKKYTGATGKINLKMLPALRSMIVGDSNRCLQLAGGKDGSVTVPPGTYQVICGKVASGTNTALIGKGDTKPITVSENGEAELTWGPPVKLDFKAVANKVKDKKGKEEKELTLSVPRLLGVGGEEYYGFKPAAAFYTVSVFDEDGKPAGKFDSWTKTGGG